MPENPQPTQRSPLSFFMVALLIFASLALPVFFWKGTWFGTSLTNEQIREYLTNTEKPRKTQHALERITERVRANDPSVSEFFPLIPPLASDQRPEIRMMAAWAMGWDTSGEGFQDALRKLTKDPVVLVRRNAALALSKFNDRACKPVLLSMLKPCEVKSPAAGTVSRLMQKGQPVRAGMVIGEVLDSSGSTTKIAAPVDGAVKRVSTSNGETLAAGDPIYKISPAQQDLWEALRALVIVGDPEDLESIRHSTDKYATKPQLIEQAKLTCEAIESRGGVE